MDEFKRNLKNNPNVNFYYSHYEKVGISLSNIFNALPKYFISACFLNHLKLKKIISD